MTLPSEFDNLTQSVCREHLNNFIHRCSQTIPFLDKGLLLEIGPQERSEVRNSFKNWNIKTLDIIPDYKPDIIGDITQFNKHIKDNTFDIITCLEILEHTLNPFNAIIELRRILKDKGFILFSAPLNWRIHGPVPDCWRFTEFGWKILLKDFDIIEIDKLETPDRNLFPMKYNILAQCNKTKNIDIKSLKFEYIS
jgi:SAM-dependent methyltransferase